MDSLRATYLARTGKFWAQGPSRSLARSTTLLLLFVLLLRFVQFFVGQAEEVRLTDAAGSAICVCICGESE